MLQHGKTLCWVFIHDMKMGESTLYYSARRLLGTILRALCKAPACRVAFELQFLSISFAVTDFPRKLPCLSEAVRGSFSSLQSMVLLSTWCQQQSSQTCTEIFSVQSSDQTPQPTKRLQGRRREMQCVASESSHAKAFQAVLSDHFWRPPGPGLPPPES